MTDQDGSDIKLAIGRLQGEVNALIRQWGEQDRAATQARRSLHEQVGCLRDEVTKLNGIVGSMKDAVAKIEREGQEDNNRYQQAIGSKKVIAMVWSAIVTVIGGLSIVFVEVLRHLWPTGKP